MGVRLFFVISGYLITSALLERRGAPVARTYGAFLWRRFLRLFPPFGLLLGILWYYDVSGIRQYILWHLSYLSNVLFVQKGDFVPWVTAHYWSLSVEEQFYILWPFFVLAPSLIAVQRLIICTIFVGIAFKAVFIAYDFSDGWLYYLPFTSLDALGCGALVAFWKRYRCTPRDLLLWGPLSAAVLMVMVYSASMRQIDFRVWFSVAQVAILPMMMVAVFEASAAKPYDLWRYLCHPLLVGLGRISYGIYLYHMAVLALCMWLGSQIGIDVPAIGWGRFLLVAAITVIVAWLSFVLIEAPLRRFKRLLPYPPRDEGRDPDGSFALAVRPSV